MLPSLDNISSSTRRSLKSLGTHTNTQSDLYKENSTVDVGSSLLVSRKSRSKSLGPGGLEVLKKSAGNRRASLATPVKIPKSILKHAISAIPEIPPLKPENQKVKNHDDKRGLVNGPSLLDEDSARFLAAGLGEEEIQVTSKEREERERRDARRKSLANRRVSFAAEATLHTFHEIEYLQDSTTSTDSTRRASSVVAKSPNKASASASDARRDHTIARPEDPNERNDNNSGSHQRTQRRSSMISPNNFVNKNDDTIASNIYSSDSDPADAVEAISEDIDEASGSDSDDGTLMNINTEEVTGMSVASDQFATPDEDSTLYEALRIAARRAGTQIFRLENEHEDSDHGEEVIPSFGWARKDNHSRNLPSTSNGLEKQLENSQIGEQESTSGIDMDMDITNAVGRIIKSPSVDEPDLLGDISMDVTSALGGILSNGTPKATAIPYQDPESAEVTMELTTAIGGICRAQGQELESIEDNEEMSMELTKVMGGVLSRHLHRRMTPSHQEPVIEQETPIRQERLDVMKNWDAANVEPKLTVDIGQMLFSAGSGSDEDENITVGMDITNAIGRIVNNGNGVSRTPNKRIMKEVDRPNSPKEVVAAVLSQSSPSRKSPRLSQVVKSTSSQSPELSEFRGKGLRRSSGQMKPELPQPDPQSPRSSPTVLKTPPNRTASNTKFEHVMPGSKARSTSTKGHRLQNQTETISSARSIRNKTPEVFRSDPETDGETPTAVLTPPNRRLSGIGADQAGLGSPQVTALCDRRCSIGETANVFIPGKQMVSFEEIEALENEVNREQQKQEEKEHQLNILECEGSRSQDSRDVTFNLREMIKSLSPKWRPVRGRKSLHIGSAKGLLGKRPAELDDGADAEDNDVMKRLKGHHGSPVKSVRLQPPPKNFESMGRVPRSGRKSLDQTAPTSTPSSTSPLKKNPTTTLQNQESSKDVAGNQKADQIKLQNSEVKDDTELDHEADEEKIHLQDFLNMISIRFMELNTTKRRHTMALKQGLDTDASDRQDGHSLERCVVAAACTVPMLELYQHSCQELKKYISKGRKMVKEIEKETFEDNPPLFLEYMSARPDVRAPMDNQFKNVKTHARLLSKAMWYEWRMKLQDGLKTGLENLIMDMEKDDELLQDQQEILASVLPAAVTRYETIKGETNILEEAAHELADSDPRELNSARQDLMAVDADIVSKKRQIAELRRQFESSCTEVDDLTLKKTCCLEKIAETEKLREKYRGWTSREVNVFKGCVEAMEKKYGWAIMGLTGTKLSMSYRKEIALRLDTNWQRKPQSGSLIELHYIADKRESNPAPVTVEREFFLHCIRHQICQMSQNRATIQDLVGAVQAGWDKARLLTSQIGRINMTFPTALTKSSDSGFSVKSSVLLATLKTKVDITLLFSGWSDPSGIKVGMSVEAAVVYGQNFNVGKINEFIMTRIGNTVDDKGEDWSDVLVDMQRKLMARGKMGLVQ